MRAAFYAEFGRKVRERRQAAGLTQVGLAARIGLDRSTLSSVESGRHGVPLHALVDLADALGCAPGDLLPDKDARKPIHAGQQIEDPFVQRIQRKAASAQPSSE